MFCQKMAEYVFVTKGKKSLENNKNCGSTRKGCLCPSDSAMPGITIRLQVAFYNTNKHLVSYKHIVKTSHPNQWVL